MDAGMEKGSLGMMVRGRAAFVVEGAGTLGVDGAYSRMPQKCHGADVFRKAGTSFVLMRHGGDGWSLVDLRGGAEHKWSLRSIELYQAVCVPAGNTPPPVGWNTIHGEDPAPLVRFAKVPLPFLVCGQEDENVKSGTKSQITKKAKAAALLARTSSTSLMARSGSMALLAKSASEPRIPGAPATLGGTMLPALGQTMRATQGLQRNGTLTKSNTLNTPNDAMRRLMKSPGQLNYFVVSFRVVLLRPSARMPWGFNFLEEPFRRNGSRLLSSVSAGSPLERWNFWQQVRGRADLCALEGDQLIRVDGRWAYCDAEAGTQDGDQAADAVLGKDAVDTGRCIVLEFARPIMRPAAPSRPQLEIWEMQSTIVIHWQALSTLQLQPPQKQCAWAVCVQDIDNAVWYAIDGTSRHAQQLGLSYTDVGVVRPDVMSLVVLDGLVAGRAYAACVAVLTESGWSSFSELSRPVVLKAYGHLTRHNIQIPDDWPGRPRVALPMELKPGATAPIELSEGAHDFTGVLGRCKLQLVLSDLTKDLGMPTRRTPSGSALLIEGITPGLAVACWNASQADSSLRIHGAIIEQVLKVGDAILSVNGVVGAAHMEQEIRGHKGTLALIVDRCTPGGAGNRGAAPIDGRLDGEASHTVEEVQWNVLMSLEEGILASRVVESNVAQLEMALQAATAVAMDTQPVRFSHEGLIEDASTRLSLRLRRESVAEDREQHQADSPDALDDVALDGLRCAMADVAMDPEQLGQSIENLSQASKSVRMSQAAQTLLKRATALSKLWSWRQRCAQVREELRLAVEDALQHEQRVGQLEQTRPAQRIRMNETQIFDFDTGPEPPHDLKELLRALEEAKKFRSEMNFQFVEASEVAQRLSRANTRHKGLRGMLDAARDPKEDENALAAAVDAAEEMDVDRRAVLAGRRKVKEWKEEHEKAAHHDELFVAVRELSRHLENRSEPGAGTQEHRRMVKAIAGAGLPPDDPLMVEAVLLLKRWDADNFALRAEARLLSAEQRAAKGYHVDEANAGDLLASAIAEVSNQGVGAEYLNRARQTLAAWQASRLRCVEKDLATAMQYSDKVFLKDAYARASVAGVDPEKLEAAKGQLQRLEMEDVVNGLLEKSMENGDDIDKLEQAIQRGHDACFLEEDSHVLHAGTLQLHLRFWRLEFMGVLSSGVIGELGSDVVRAQAVLEESSKLLEAMRELEAPPELPIRTLERDMRLLELEMPRMRKMASVSTAEVALQRVLGAVERYAADLPEVIAQGKEQIENGIDENLVHRCVKHLQSYEETVRELEDLISREDAPDADVKSAVVRGRLAGLPDDLVSRGLKYLQENNEAVYAGTLCELELLVALREADDVGELSPDGRFLRLEDAADQAKKQLSLPPEVEEEVENTRIALASERELGLKVKSAEEMLSRPAMHSEVAECGENLRRACIGARRHAQEEAKKGLSAAEQLADELQGNARARETALHEALAVVKGRAVQAKDIRMALVAAREQFVPGELLADPYARLRKKKLECIASNFREAVAAQRVTLAAGLWYRGMALRAGDERGGQDWKSPEFMNFAQQWAANGGIAVQGVLSGHCDGPVGGGGSFGTRAWRRNPCYMVRVAATDSPSRRGSRFDASTGSRPSVTGDLTHAVSYQSQRSDSMGLSSGPPKVTVVLAEAGDSPATLAVHVVRNNRQVAATCCGPFLAPGFEVLASSRDDDEIPDCTFELPLYTEDRPVFIMPSAARGEEGPFTLVVEGTQPVEVTEVSGLARWPWRDEHQAVLEWANKRPHAMIMGGGRTAAVAPPLSWYRNPQFSVRLKRPQPVEIPDAAFPRGGVGPLLMALLTPHGGAVGDVRAAAAVHIVRHRTRPTEDRDICENPRHHTVIACSGPDGKEYAAASEIGAMCQLPPSGEAVVVIPSLQSRKSEDKYTLQLFATEEVVVTRVR